MTAGAAAASLAGLARRKDGRRRFLLGALALSSAAAALAAAGTGALDIAPAQILSILLDRAGVALPWGHEPLQANVLLEIRLPRVCLGLLTGAALAVAGAALQGLFRNPLADPGLVGVSSGAALAAAAVIVFAPPAAAAFSALLAAFLLPMAAFAGALAAAFAVYRIASRGGRTDVASMLLAGIAVNAIAAAGIGGLVFLGDDREIRDLNFWMLGSLGGAAWASLLPVAPFILLAVALLARLARPLDALLLGETEAWHLGFDVERAKRRIVVLAALAAGASVALTGVIGFVGLVAPHLARLAFGPGHRTLLPAAMLLGAALVTLADLAARTLVLPAELPLGVLTNLIGGPFFLWLLARRAAAGFA